ncbi:MAG: hypothetical protein KIT22_13415 [Verrucomicrobiae bacterium]|nr:hypothetical protein [Verrucomicrobiae bacterium]
MLARSNGILPFTPAADQTGQEGLFVEVAGGNVSVVNAATDVPLGVILEGRPTTGKSSIGLSDGGLAGTAKVKLAATPGTVVLGAYLVLDGTTLGAVKLDPGTGARVRVARALEAGAAGELIEAVLITPAVLA